MRTEEEIHQRIKELKKKKKYVSKGVTSKYNRIIEQLRWVLGEDVGF